MDHSPSLKVAKAVTQARQNPGLINEAVLDHEAMLLTGSLPHIILKQLSHTAQGQGVAPHTVGWVIPHQSNNALETHQYVNLMEAFLS